jgi:hypothetical protein
MIIDEAVPENEFIKLLYQKGHEFESLVVSTFQKKTGIHIPSIGTEVTDENVQKTINAMKKGYPMIHSAPLSSYTMKLGGVADLLIRSDCLHLFIKDTHLERAVRYKPAPLISNMYHYVVCEVKYRTLEMMSDGVHLLNNPKNKAAKTQLYIYNQILGELQGYTPSLAFMIGRRCQYYQNQVKYRISKFDDRLGTVDFEGRDHRVVEESVKAIEWVRDCKVDAPDWDVLPLPSRIELYPNMCNQSIWDYTKKNIATSIGDITQIWQCGPMVRNNMVGRGITSFYDPKCTADALGLRGEKAVVVDAILDIQRQSVDLIRILSDIDLDRRENEFYIDFEIIPESLCDDFKSEYCDRRSHLFLIGIGWGVDEWNYKSFVAANMSDASVCRIIDQVIDFIPDGATLYHWNHTEKTYFTNFLKTHRIQCDKKFEWVDLFHLFQTTPIVLKGCLDFKLKSIATQMFENGWIQTNWTNEMKNGLECSVEAYYAYRRGLELNTSIIGYNEKDCKVLWEILEYLRKR